MKCSHCKRTIDGQAVYLAYGTDHCRMCDVLLAGSEPLAANQPGAWPIISDALAVHPSQVQQARERNKRHGVPVWYMLDGRAILPDRAARKKLLKLEGFHDNSGGYGD